MRFLLILFTGRSGMGKTTLAVKVILKRYINVVNQVFAICPTFWVQAPLEPLRKIPNCFNDSNVFTNVTEGIFKRVLNLIVSNKKRPKTLLFIDDAAGDFCTNRGNKGSFAKLSIAAPHLNLSIIGIFQQAKTASPSFRNNCEGLVSFVSNRRADVEIICNEFNPLPASNNSPNLVNRAIVQAWKEARFLFVWRGQFDVNTTFFGGFNKKIEFNLPRIYANNTHVPIQSSKEEYMGECEKNGRNDEETSSSENSDSDNMSY
jgi:hypothetical protein